MLAARIPTATYRIQFNLQFRFPDARELVPYLHDLGIGDLYASPRFKARKGSSHGYDVADPERINSDLGTEEEFAELVRRLQSHRMGLLLDIVPNHMAATHENPRWMDVLENGPSSAYARHFDIDWHPATTKAAFLQEGRVLLPVLGDLYGNVLEKQELALKLDDGGLHLRYFESRFPLELKSYAVILRRVADRLRESGAAEPVLAELLSILALAEGLPPFTSEDERDREQRRTGGPEIKKRLWQLCQSDTGVRQALDEELQRLRGVPDAAAGLADLDRLLAQQPYRLAHWKVALAEINYRRFFDINELVCLRVEDPEVFAQRHRVIAQLAREGAITGLRVDHVDGLHDPRGYLEMLQQAIGPASAGAGFYVVVEKILGERESLPEEWPVCGTTGYDFLNVVNTLLVDPDGYAQMEQIYSRFTGSAAPFAEVSYQGNKQVMDELFAGELHVLVYQLLKLAALDWHARDLPMADLEELLREVTACLPVYRTYLRDYVVSSRDRYYIERALALARLRTSRAQVSDDALAFLRRVLLLDPPPYLAEKKSDFLGFVMRWQQFTGPVMAKGLEDTASYVRCALASLNEVGADPLRENLPLEVEAFHLFNQDRLAKWPATLNATSTHDTKRSEDVRARISVLSELTEEWEAALTRWSRWNFPRKRAVRDHMAPTPAEEALLYQTLLGAWPLTEAGLAGFAERVKAYMVKAAREAKVFTNWISPDAAHEAALESFVDQLLDTSVRNRFLSDFFRLQKRVAFFGALNALSQVLLKIASPGVPDFYQGTELWDFSLVDPDNRRPVDFSVRARALESLRLEEARDKAALLAELTRNWMDGRIKLFLTSKALRFRREHPGLFLEGEYLPVYSKGAKRNQVCAFIRRRERQWVLAAVPRLCSRLCDSGEFPLGRAVWRASALSLPRGAPLEWTDVFTGDRLRARSAGERTLALQAAFRVLPFSLLFAEQ